jgi:hypothetical protein
VHAAQPADIAEQRPVEPDDVAEEVRLVGETLHGVADRGHVRGHPFVPVRTVHITVVSHRPTMPHHRLPAHSLIGGTSVAVVTTELSCRHWGRTDPLAANVGGLD